MVDLLPRLKEYGHDVELLLFDGTDTPLRRQIEAAGVHVLQIRNGGSFYSFINLIKLIPYLHKYDIVHTHNTAAQIFAAIGSMFCSVHLCTTEHNTSNHRRDIKWYLPIDRWMYNRYSHIVCCSHEVEDNLRKYLGHCKANICTVYNGIDVDHYANEVPSNELRCIAPNCKYITMVAGFRWEKDQDTLIRGMVYLPAKFHLFLIGEGQRRRECEILAKDCGVASRVHFMGLRADASSIICASDYVVMSSHFEGLSLASVEGMSVGKPFLASNVDGLRDVVENAGLLFEHGNSKDFARLVEELDANSDLYQAIASKCRIRAGQFDISKMAEGYHQVYKAVMNS
jgi:glycosyltransferase involved in cell wall biosynthesis